MKKIFNKKFLKEYLFITFGVFLVALSFSFFLDPYDLVIGGVSGLAIIFKQLIDTSTFMLITNVLLLLIGLMFLGKDFFVKTAYGSLMFPILTYPLNALYKFLCEYSGHDHLVSTNDLLLVTVFGALIMGMGIGIAIKHGGTTGGTEVAQSILYKFFRMPYSVSLFLFDGIIVLLGFFFVRDLNGNFQFTNLLYAIIFIYLSGMVTDQIVFRGFNKRAVHIISEKNDEIKKRILEDFERGVTQIHAVGGYTGENRNKLVCVLSTSEFYKLKMIINDIDPKAFYYVVRASEVGGEGFTYNEM